MGSDTTLPLFAGLKAAPIILYSYPNAALPENRTLSTVSIGAPNLVDASEALNFRKELKDLEVSEAQRINKLRINNIQKQENTLLAEQRKEMEHLLSKLKNEENKLIIRMKRDFDVLNKKVHLHENEIKKIQGLAAKYAMQKA